MMKDSSIKKKENREIYITALHLGHGGAEMAITNLANGLAQRGYQVTIWCIYRLGEPAYRLHKEVCVEYLTTDIPNREEFKEAVRKARFITAFHEGMRAIRTLYDKKKVIIDRIRGIHSGVIISTRLEHNLLLSKYGNKDVIKIGQCHYGAAFGWRLKLQLKTGYHGLHYFVLLTETLREEAAAICGKGVKCVCIGNYLEDEVISQLKEQKNAQPQSQNMAVQRQDWTNVQLQEQTLSEKSIKQVLSVGRLSYEKGFDRLIEAWNRIGARYPDWRLVIIGDGIEKQKLTQLSECENVVFLGNLPHEEVLWYMKASDIYALPSRTEGFPYVLLEAGNAGLPLIAFDVRTGPRMMIKDGETGVLVPDHRIEEYAAKLEELMTNTKLCDRYSKAEKEFLTRFTKASTLDQWERLIER